MRRFIFPVLLLAALGACGVWSYPAWGLLSKFAAFPSVPRQPITFLLAGVGHHYVGYHTRGTLENDFSLGLTDTMVLVQLSPAQKAIKLLSIPRDTHVGAGNTTRDKINAAMLGGFDSSVRAVEGLLNLKLDGYLFVSIDGTKALVDALGGVKIYVPQAMQYSDKAAKLEINLKPGWQVLTGREAEGFVRFRYDNLGDIGRTQRQQAFFRALLEKLQQPASWGRLPQLAKVFEKHVRTNLTRSEVGAALGFFTQRPRVDTLLLPGNFGRLGRYSFWIPDDQALRDLVDSNLRNAKDTKSRDPFELSIAIVATDVARGKRARERLQAAGFRFVWLADATPGDPSKTEVLSSSSLLEARVIRTKLGVGTERISGEGVLGADITVRLGANY
jgi:polyisoprenyl-teichoic acid--peptidoglycan teichoic acid transferase